MDKTMKYLKPKILHALLVSLISLLVASTAMAEADASGLDKFSNETRVIVADFTASLIRRCEMEIESIGLHAATEVCRITAPQVYYEYSIKNDIILNLVSLTPRNAVTGHADAWEQAGLLKMQEMLKQGVDSGKIEIIELVKEPAASYYRYMSPLIATPFCLKCHGETTQLDKSAETSIDFLYPTDKAKGYKLGDILGAVSVKKEYIPTE
jgi:hypothetical protein